MNHNRSKDLSHALYSFRVGGVGKNESSLVTSMMETLDGGVAGSVGLSDESKGMEMVSSMLSGRSSGSSSRRSGVSGVIGSRHVRSRIYRQLDGMSRGVSGSGMSGVSGISGGSGLTSGMTWSPSANSIAFVGRFSPSLPGDGWTSRRRNASTIRQMGRSTDARRVRNFGLTSSGETSSGVNKDMSSLDRDRGAWVRRLVPESWSMSELSSRRSEWAGSVAVCYRGHWMSMETFEGWLNWGNDSSRSVPGMASQLLNQGSLRLTLRLTQWKEMLTSDLLSSAAMST